MPAALSQKWPADHGIFAPPVVIAPGVTDVVVQSAALLSMGGASNDLLRNDGDVAQFDQIGLRIQNVFVVNNDLALRDNAVGKIVHTVKTPQQR